MRVTVAKVQGLEMMQEACNFTMNHRGDSHISLDSMYDCEHSPMRTQLFVIRMYDIYAYVSTHFVRHATVGQLHYVGTHREDRGGQKEADRYTLVDHMMILNAQHLTEMSRKRLCYKASTDTFQVMAEIKLKISGADPSLAKFMIPNCEYRQGCHEIKSCGYWEGVNGRR